MSFRPRFRLSLLFVVIALVAGVSVWLRQAVVRDRNIRELMTQQYARGYINSDASNFNTRILNYFSDENAYCDNIKGIFINIERISVSDFVGRYQGVDLGDGLAVLMFEVRPDSNKTLPLSLSEISQVVKLFNSVDGLWFYSVQLLDDMKPVEKLDCHCIQLDVSKCETDSDTIGKLIDIVQSKPKQLVLVDNQIQGKWDDLKHLDGFDDALLNYYKKMNWFSAEKSTTVEQ